VSKKNNLIAVIFSAAVLALVVVFYIFQAQLIEILGARSSALLSTGTLVRNVGVALFAMSVWFSQRQTARAAELLNACDFETKELIALQLVISLRDIKGLQELRDSIDLGDLKLLERKINVLRRIDKLRNASILLFIIGVSIEIFEVSLQWI
jgi:hypothetical protein